MVENDSLEIRIINDYQKALKEGRKNEISFLRFIRSEIKNKEIQKRDTLNNEEIVKALRSLLKKEREALDFFINGKREKLIEKTKEEITIIEKYLPANLSLKEIEKISREIISKNNLGNEKDFNIAIKLIMNEIKFHADGRMVSEVVRKILNKNAS
ncbi:MAG: GatB/YqeY domain-containing protein [Atribacterota bacterium]|nr:GatB/YqeY domain-containing protein [Atribacterota bacterium]MDD5638035.1 GatB/YqeY domain-containing protein [Atribacterota bacterium]